MFTFSLSFLCRYRVLLESILTNPANELIETLKLFIEASKSTGRSEWDAFSY